MTAARRIPVEDLRGLDALPALRDGPVRPDWLLVLAHGAGAAMTSDFMTELTAALARSGVGVLRFDFPYTALGKRAPDRTPVLEAAWKAVFAYAAAHRRQARLAVGGKSMGGRIATQILAQDPGVAAGPLPDAAVLFGYPLHPPGKPEKLRDAHLAELAKRVPALFLQGDRDTLARIDLVNKTVARMNRQRKGSATLHVVEDASHDFAVPKRTGRTRSGVITELAETTAAWLRAI